VFEKLIVFEALHLPGPEQELAGRLRRTRRVALTHPRQRGQ
jgi:hypothetical protein